MMKHIFLIISIIAQCVCAAAQPLCQIKHFSVNNGLSQGVVTGILQDQKGFIWLSTWNGLDKFDGYNFKNYKAYSGDSCTLSNNRITYISESKYGNIWCLSYDGRSFLFDKEEERFIDVLKPIEEETKTVNVITQIYVLPKGVTWATTNKGATFRIDEGTYLTGNGVEIYNPSNQNLKGKRIHTIQQDSDGDEWILTNKGINIIGNKKIDSDFPFYFMKEVNGTIFLISEKGKMAFYDRTSSRIKFIDIPFDFQSVKSVSVFEDNEIALCTNNGIILYQIANNEFKQLDLNTKSHASNIANLAYKDKTGAIWCFSNLSGIIRFEPETYEKSHLFTPSHEVLKYPRANRNFIYEDNIGTVWVLPSKGNFSFYNPDSKQLETYYADKNERSTAFYPNIRGYFSDRQGNLWFMSARGIEKMSFFPNSYEHYPIDMGNEIRAFFRDNKNRLWVSSKTGFMRIYTPDGELLGYLSPQGKIEKSASHFIGNTYCFMQDDKGIIWLGTKEDGVFQLTEKENSTFQIKQYTHQEEDEYSLSNNSVYAIHQDSKGRIWIGSYGGGLNLFDNSDLNKPKFIHSNNRLNNFPSTHFMKIRCLAEDANGVMMIGTTEGLLTYSNDFDKPEEIKFYQNIRKPSIESSLGSNDVIQIYSDRNNHIYISTFTGGLSKVLSSNLLTDSIAFKTYTIRDGMISDLTLSTIEDGQENLWIVSENAISCFNPQTETFENFDNKFLQKEFNFSEAMPTLDAQGRLIFGSDRGFIAVDPLRITKKNYVPPIVFTGIKIQGSPAMSGVDELESLLLKPSQRNITIHYSALDYVSPEEIQYAYRLEELEDEWNEVDKSRSASYINLPPGSYNLQVRSTNSDGVWVDNIRTLPIKVRATFWETPWAWLFYVFLFLLLTGTSIYVLFYIYRLRHQVDVEQQLANIKLRFFTDISHELRTPLTLISSPVNEILEQEEISSNVRSHLNLVHKNTERMLRLVNEILDFRKIENKKMKLLIEETNLNLFLEKIMDNFRLIAEEKQIDFKLEANVSNLHIWMDRDKIEKILFNLISNSFKYTPMGKSIIVSIERDDDKVAISVIDQGVGIEASKQKSLFQRFETVPQQNTLHSSSGIGLSLTKELVELHHGTIELNSQAGCGSRFCVTFPLSKSIYENDPVVEFILADSSINEQQTATTANVESMIDTTSQNKADTEAMTILIVEDNLELRTFLKNILKDIYQVIEAENGQDGLYKAQQQLPDMIISDVMMPVMDGLDMVKQIKEDHTICHIPIILLSAKSSLDDRIAGLEKGIDDYITKPFSATYLKTRIASLLQQRKRLQESYLAQLSIDKTDKELELNPTQPQVTPYDETFMKQVMDFMEQQMDNAELAIDDFADHLRLSRTVFYRKLKSIVGLTPVDFIRDIRIKRAIQLIDTGEFNVSQIAYMIGFNDPKYFSKCFKKQTGLTPSEYKDQRSKN